MLSASRWLSSSSLNPLRLPLLVCSFLLPCKREKQGHLLAHAANNEPRAPKVLQHKAYGRHSSGRRHCGVIQSMHCMSHLTLKRPFARSNSERQREDTNPVVVKPSLDLESTALRSSTLNVPKLSPDSSGLDIPSMPGGITWRSVPTKDLTATNLRELQHCVVLVHKAWPSNPNPKGHLGTAHATTPSRSIQT